MGLIFIRRLELPERIKGVTVTDANGDFNIYINSRLSDEEQKRTAGHELRHIELNHFYNSEPVVFNELEAK